MFNTVKRFYDKGIYSAGDVAMFVKAKKMTAEDYKKITGEAYTG